MGWRSKMHDRRIRKLEQELSETKSALQVAVKENELLAQILLKYRNLVELDNAQIEKDLARVRRPQETEGV